MVFYGPWKTPTSTRMGQMGVLGVPTAVAYTLGRTYDNGTFANVADGLTFASAWPGPASAHGAEYGYQHFGQGIVRFTPASYDLPPYVNELSPPAGTVGVEFEQPSGTMLTSPTVQYRVVVNQFRTVAGVHGLPGVEPFDVFDIPVGDGMLSGTLNFTWQNRAALAGRASQILDTRVFDNAGTAHIYTPLTTHGPFDPVNIFFTATAQRTGTDWESTDFLDATSVGVATLAEYIGPRYRWLYNVPLRLRQFPRDDALGGAPRQGHRNGATSTQASTRQGWRGTYR